MPESWEIKLNEFYKLLEGQEQAIKQGTAVHEPEAEPIQRVERPAPAEPEQPGAVKPWPPPIPGLPKREAQAPPRPTPIEKPEPVRVGGSAAEATAASAQLDLSIPKLEDFLPFLKDSPEEPAVELEPQRQEAPQNILFSRPAVTETKPAPPPAARTAQPPHIEIQQAWDRLPRHIQMLVGSIPKETAQRYYTKKFKESRDELVQRLLDPPLTLEETARILNVCPMTVRRYTNRGALPHFRTAGNQRRFRLSDVLSFLEAHSGAVEC